MVKILKYSSKQKTANDNFLFYILAKIWGCCTMLLYKQLSFFLTLKQCTSCRDIHVL